MFVLHELVQYLQRGIIQIAVSDGNASQYEPFVRFDSETLGGGSLHTRVLVLAPEPHLTLQADHGDHTDQYALTFK